MNFRSPVAIIFLIIAVIGAIIWSYFATKKPAATPSTTPAAVVSNLTNMDPTDFDSIVNNERSVADQKAAEVRSDFKLAAVEIEIGKTLMPDTVNARYIYVSPSDTANNWMITISEPSSSFIRALVPKSDYLGNLQQMDTKYWKYNYVTALQLAEKNGGQDWRSKNTLASVKLTLRHTGANNWLLWIVEYSSDSDKLTVTLDANSGKVVTQ